MYLFVYVASALAAAAPAALIKILTPTVNRMKKPNITYAVIGLLIVLSPILILALHYHNRIEKFAADQRNALNYFMSQSSEYFAASQGGAFQQLASTRVSSEAEVAQNYENEKRQVVNDILNMTEPESFPGPKPGSI